MMTDMKSAFHLLKLPLSEKADRGAIAVEYAFGMLLAAGLMLTVEWLFRNMAIEVINIFKQIVIQFPDI